MKMPQPSCQQPQLPAPLDGEAAERAFGDLEREGEAAGLIALARSSSAVHRLLAAVFGASPYLTDLIRREPAFAAAALDGLPAALLETLCTQARAAARLEAQAELAVLLRRIKARAALLVALADLSGSWSIEKVTAALTEAADALLGAAVDWLLREAERRGRLRLRDREAPGRGCGYAVLAMGKLGAHELNYSSDVDLIVLYDPETAPLTQGVEPATFFVRLTKQLIGLLQDVTEHGYVFRVDLRLRPDPRATQVAIGFEAAALYYESMGQNWERAAMIKARAAAGDLALGAEFLDRLKPYIWRKYLDFAAIADIQSLKRQIHAVKGHGAIAVHGHNVKLGLGGIREIEFFVQTQQLIAGGRNPALRGRRTLDMLDALAQAGWIGPQAAEELKSAYRFLRHVEHRIQMVADEQSHVLPTDALAFARLARFAGYDTAEAFALGLRSAFETVQRHSAALFEQAEGLGTASGSLVFTGGEDDPETLETLARLGFRQPREVAGIVRSWHFGRYRAMRSARAKELLTELMPALLSSLAKTGEPDQAFLAFDRFLSGLPTGVQMFSLIKANPKLLDLIASVLGTAPRLASLMSHQPKVLDAVIDPAFFGPLPGSDEIERTVDLILAPKATLEETAERARIIGREQAFRIGVRVLSETVSAEEAGAAFSGLATVLLRRLHQAARLDLEAVHGTVPGGASVIIALGKLGGHEMTAASDLDLILVYDVEGEGSGGKRPLSTPHYFARLTQRLISSITAPTAEGVLYEVDMRLRPSGNKGPVATSRPSFEAYHRDAAWTWERLALTRARVVSGDAELKGRVEAVIAAALTAPREPERTLADVLDMRRLMLKELGWASVWDIKRVRGGLVDIEFIAQCLQLMFGPRYPAVFRQNTLAALDALEAANCLSPTAAQELRQATRLYQRLTQVLRLCVAGAYDPAAAPAGLNRAVATAAAMPDIARTEALLAETQSLVAGLFAELVGVP